MSTTEVLNLGTHDPSRSVHCASERGSFILLELAAMMLSTPPQVQRLGEVQRHIYLYIMLPEIGAVYNHEYM